MFIDADGTSKVTLVLLIRTSTGVVTISRIAIPAIGPATGVTIVVLTCRQASSTEAAL
jgi:hypothetical protein